MIFFETNHYHQAEVGITLGETGREVTDFLISRSRPVGRVKVTTTMTRKEVSQRGMGIHWLIITNVI